MRLPVWIAEPLRTLLGVEQDARLLMARDEHLRQQVAYIADWLQNIDDVVYNLGKLVNLQASRAAGVSMNPDPQDIPAGATVATAADVEARAAEIREQVSKMKREFPLALKELQQNGNQ